MNDFDWVEIALWTNLVAIGIAIVTAIYLAWNNSGSKNIPLAAAALVGVMVGYVIQLPFELIRSTDHETIGVQFTIDRAVPVIRQWVYTDDVETSWRLPAEIAASNWLARTNPTAFDQPARRDKLAIDLTVYSLLSYLTHAEYDWQLQRKSYGSVEMSQAVSRPDECSTYLASDLKQRLGKADNLFAAAPLQILSNKFCLPPGTKLEISANALTLTNPFCQIVFRSEHPGHMILNVHPTTRQYVGFGNGQPRYEIRQMGFSVETTFFALRAQHRNSKQYHDWASRVVDGARRWFAPGNPQGQPQQFVESPAGTVTSPQP